MRDRVMFDLGIKEIIGNEVVMKCGCEGNEAIGWAGCGVHWYNEDGELEPELLRATNIHEINRIIEKRNSK